MKAFNMQNYTSVFYFLIAVVPTQCGNLIALTARASMDNTGSFQPHRGTQKFIDTSTNDTCLPCRYT